MRRFIFYIFMALFLNACFPYQNMVHESSAYAKNDTSNHFKNLKYSNKRNLSYVYSNPNNKKNIAVLIHGSPGSWKSFSHFLEKQYLLKHFGLLIIDRPGYGKFIKEGSEPSLNKQAKMMNAILKHHFDQSYTITLVGHSYGGPLIAQMAINLGNELNIKTLYFLASSLDPNLEKTKWFQYPAQWIILKWLIPKNLIHCNEEILHLKQDLIELKSQLYQLSEKNILILHGDEDKLVPLGNVNYMQSYMSVPKNNITVLNKVNHFIPWSHSELIAQTLIESIKS